MATNLISRVDDYQRTLITNPITGMRESVLVEQIRGKEISKTEKKYSTFAASSFNAGYLQSSSQILKYIVNGRLGQVTKAWLQFQIQVSNAPVKLLPAFMWIDQLNSFKDSTNTKGMDANWFSILLSLSNLTPAQFKPLAQMMLCDPDDAWTTSFLPVGTYNVYVPLYDSCLLTGAHLKYYPENMNMQIISPQGGCVEQGNPLNVTLLSSNLVLEETDVPVAKAAIIEQSYSYPFKRFFLDWQVYNNQTVTVANGGGPVQIKMDNLSGVIPFLIYGLRASTSPVNGACKRFVSLGSKLGSCSVNLFNAAGKSILNQAIDPYLQQSIQAVSSYGEVLNGDWSNIYFLDFTKDRIASINGIISAGWRKAEINDYIQINFNTQYVAEVPRVITFTTIDGTGTASAATAGSFQLSYCDGRGLAFTSAIISYNSTQAAVQTALDNMVIYGGVTLTAGSTNVNSLQGLTITMINLSDFDTAVQGARWSVMTSTLRNASAAVFPSMTDVGGSMQVGVAPGTYQTFILFPKFSCYKLTPTATQGNPVTVSYAVDAASIKEGELR